jgi:hypothetical protein
MRNWSIPAGHLWRGFSHPPYFFFLLLFWVGGRTSRSAHSLQTARCGAGADDFVCVIIHELAHLLISAKLAFMQKQ